MHLDGVHQVRSPEQMAGTVFVGRRGELDRLGRVLRGDTGACAAAVVTGDAGIGKTRLLAEVVAAEPGVQVLAGACLPLSQSLPFGAVAEAFAGLTGPTGRPALDRALDRCSPFVRPQIAALVPALSTGAEVSPALADDRIRLFSAVRDLLGALGAERRTALVVEDLHWADAGTLDLLTFLVRGLPAGTALLATSRRDELPAGSPALDWLSTTTRLPGIEAVDLAPLPQDDMADLVASLLDVTPTAVFVADVVRRGEGSPFFTEQLVAAARDVAPPLEVPPGVPPGVAQMLLGRIRSVSGPGADVAAALAVAARPLTEAELAACVGPGVDVAVGLRTLLDAHLVAPAEHDRYRLRHALLEDTVSGTLLGSQRAVLHAGVAGVLAARTGEAPGEVAAHWGRAGRRVEEASWSVAAARHAEGLFAWREASAAWRRVWDLWSSLSDDERPDVELAEAVVACVRTAARVDLTSDLYDSFLDLAQEALADDRVSSDDYAAGQLLHAYGSRLAMTDMAAGTAAWERAVELFEHAGRPAAEHARAVGQLVMRRFLEGNRTGTEDEELARAAAIAAQGGHLDTELQLTSGRGQALLEAGRVEEALAVLAQAQQRALDGDSGAGHLAVASAVTDSYLWLLRLRDGVDAGRMGIARALGDGHRESFGFSILVTNTVDCLLLLGDTEAATALVTEYKVPELTINGWPQHLSRAELDVLADKHAAALHSVERLEALEYNNEELWLWLAEIGAAADLWSGRAQSARNRIAPVMERIRPSPRAARAGRMLAFAAWAAADLADANPALDREELAGQLQQWADEAECVGAHPGRVMGAAYGVTFDGEIARLRRTGEEVAWRAAKDRWTSHDVPHHAAYAGWRLAERLLADGRRKEAETELAAAYAGAERHVPLRREIDGLARRARVSLRVTDQAAPAAASGDDTHGLTPRELAVLRLLGSGATNVEIGRKLFMSPKTASVHVTAILRKLGVTGRVQAATVAERMGLLGPEGKSSDHP
jgi:DNA-binding CsgD family transcriptional regulator